MRSTESRIAPVEGVPLAPLSTLRVGGPARWFVRARNVSEVAAACAWGRDRGVPVFVLGGGSNIVVADGGYSGLVLQIALSGVTTSDESGFTLVTAAAGEAWDPLVSALVARGLAGVECLSGIPGSVGATPIQNVGAYGQEVADTIDRVTVYDRETGEVRILEAADCRFSYRSSRFKGADAGRFILCAVTFRLSETVQRPAYPDIVAYLERAGIRSPSVLDVRDATLAVRRRKGMVIDDADPDTRSVGSFFMNPILSAADRERIATAAGAAPPAFALPGGRVKVPAAWLIERSGFHRGDREGTAAISTKHTLALVTRGGATARDVLRLAARIKRQVGERFGVWLRPEPVFVGLEAEPDADFLTRNIDVDSTH